MKLSTVRTTVTYTEIGGEPIVLPSKEIQTFMGDEALTLVYELPTRKFSAFLGDQREEAILSEPDWLGLMLEDGVSIKANYKKLNIDPKISRVLAPIRRVDDQMHVHLIDMGHQNRALIDVRVPVFQKLTRLEIKIEPLPVS